GVDTIKRRAELSCRYRLVEQIIESGSKYLLVNDSGADDAHIRNLEVEKLFRCIGKAEFLSELRCFAALEFRGRRRRRENRAGRGQVQRANALRQRRMTHHGNPGSCRQKNALATEHVLSLTRYSLN